MKLAIQTIIRLIAQLEHAQKHNHLMKNETQLQIESLKKALEILNRCSSISELTEEQQFYITLIAQLNTELVTEQIITPTQQNQISRYMVKKLSANCKKKEQ